MAITPTIEPFLSTGQAAVQCGYATSDRSQPMKFFVSGANDEADAERVYQTVKEFVAKQTMPLEDRRIFSITYMHDGTRYHAEIGKPML